MPTTPEIPGPNVMLVGATGTGKTHSLRTLLPEMPDGVFVLFTEPGMEVLADLSCKDGLHYAYIPPASPDWQAMLDSAKRINTLTYESLAKLSDVNKRKYDQFITVLQTLNNFTCQRCGETFGDVSTWPNTRALCIDSLSGLNVMAMNLVVGSKPTKAMSDWMVAQDNLERLLQKLCTDTQCAFVLTAHLERETDEVTGGVQLMASTLGRKLAPRLPRFFSDVVMCRRDGANFFWSTATLNVDTKARNVPWSEKLPPDFARLISTWRSRHAGK